MGAAHEGRAKARSRRVLDEQQQADLHVWCKRERHRLELALLSAEKRIAELEVSAADLARAKRSLELVRAEKALMLAAYQLAEERARNLTSYRHRYGAMVVLSTIKEYMR
jgi:hypothetical protein